MKILCLGKLPDDLSADLQKLGSFSLIERSRALNEEALGKALEDIDVLLTEPQDILPIAALEQAGKLKLIAQRAVGFDNIPLEYASRRLILVTNTPGVLDNATADLAFGLLLACARRLPEADRYVRDGHWQGFQSDLLLGCEISGKTIGLVGMGRIALAMARRAYGFGMNIIYSRSQSGTKAQDDKDLELENSLGARRVDLEELLRTSDFISLHCPLNAATTELIKEREFAMMKPSCIFINTGRGKLVDEAALIHALQTGKIKGAGLDVFYDEPHVPRALIEAPNVVLSPHIGSASAETRYNMAKLSSDGIKLAFSGQMPPNVLNGHIFAHWMEKVISQRLTSL